MALKKKKKKILKKKEEAIKPPEPEMQPEIIEDPEEPAEKEFEMPYSLTSESMKKESDKLRDETITREEQIKSFIVPDGYKVIQVIEHKELSLEEVSPQAEKELNFWKKYKPDRFYETVRHDTLVTFLVARPANKTEEVENLRKKRKKAQ